MFLIKIEEDTYFLDNQRESMRVLCLELIPIRYKKIKKNNIILSTDDRCEQFNPYVDTDKDLKRLQE